MKPLLEQRRLPAALMLLALAVTAAVYWPGLHGGFLFDDYPNIVDNPGVQPHHVNMTSLLTAALSSPSSEFKRPLASLSFAANFIASGLDPFWMKLTNLVIHLLNGLVMFFLAKRLLESGSSSERNNTRTATVAAVITAGWLLLPINLSGVLYVVQRMESLANLFVLLGLLGYVTGRNRMLADPSRGGLVLSFASVVFATAIGLTAKETAVMLPFYAFLIEWIIYRFRNGAGRTSRALPAFYLLVLALPLVAGLAWLLPGLMQGSAWATRDFIMTTRLLSEARIVVDYVDWTLLPTLHSLSFYHDDFRISSGLLRPWTTLASILILAGAVAAIIRFRKRRPLVALGLALYLGCHLLTGTILPLELIYEHRNYFASFGLLLALIPILMARQAPREHKNELSLPRATAELDRPIPMATARAVLLVALMLLWTVQTAVTAFSWGNPLRLAEDLAARAPRSPRAQYELGRTYIIYSRYDPQSAFTELAYGPLERAMSLPESSILPEQALIFMNSRMRLPIKDAWWDSLIGKLRSRIPGVQDESSLAALVKCARDRQCDLSTTRMHDALDAALSHPHPSARLLAIAADYAWNVNDDRPLGLRLAHAAVEADPNEPAYRVTEAQMLIASGQHAAAMASIKQLNRINIGGQLDGEIRNLRASLTRLPSAQSTRSPN